MLLLGEKNRIMGTRETGRLGKQDNGSSGKWETEMVGMRETGKSEERDTEKLGNSDNGKTGKHRKQVTKNRYLQDGANQNTATATSTSNGRSSASTSRSTFHRTIAKPRKRMNTPAFHLISLIEINLFLPLK